VIRHVSVLNRSRGGSDEAFDHQTLRCAQGERSCYFTVPDQ
jgi:hypothetical protein